MKEVAKILGYFVAGVMLGAALAPPLYWCGRALAAHGVFPFLAEVEFQKFFNRAVLVAAIALLWPTIRWLRVASWRELGLDPDPRWGQRWLAGFTIGALLLAIMAGIYVSFDIYKWKKVLPWEKLPAVALSAISVAVLEEALFRGAIFGIFRRVLPPYPALLWVTAIFALVHFLKPDDAAAFTRVDWLSGFALVPHAFHQFAEPAKLAAGFTTIFVLGWVLGYATMKTRSLWMAIGLHAGVVFVKMSFSKLTKRQEEFMPWIGRELQIGLVPVAVLALAGLLVWWWLKYVDRPFAPLPKDHLYH